MNTVQGSRLSVERVLDARQPSNELVEYDVALRGVCHWYGRTQVLTDVALSVRRGEFFGLLGPSGSGKSTTLRIIGGFIAPTAGEVYVGGELMGDRPPYQRNTTMVFQHLALFPHMSVFDNLAYGLKLRHVPRQEIESRVAAALNRVHLVGLEKRYPGQLSGGQQQRVALARALILEPSVVLFDEPLGSLDLKLRRELRAEIKDIQRSLGKTFLYVTHDQQEAITMCDRIAIMNEGRVVQVGTVSDIYERPLTRFVADFVGDSNFVEGKIVSVDGMVATIQSGGMTFKGDNRRGFRKGDEALLCIRPERVVIGSAANGCHNRVSVRIVDQVYTGAQRRCTVTMDSGLSLLVDLDARAAATLNIGDTVSAGWDISDAHFVSP